MRLTIGPYVSFEGVSATRKGFDGQPSDWHSPRLNYYLPGFLLISAEHLRQTEIRDLNPFTFLNQDISRSQITITDMKIDIRGLYQSMLLTHIVGGLLTNLELFF